ncbi:hypothetical protein HAX54_028144 [Datura stramonium]|uniref:Uncharacterized protein n=1 Tax=Datura stramonium TaxID=4076 RepID=A0ABS8V519_DATST|nr:hypothetical protein [Datura stramonium]
MESDVPLNGKGGVGEEFFTPTFGSTESSNPTLNSSNSPVGVGQPSNPPAEPSSPTGQPSNPHVESSNPTSQPSNPPIESQTDDDPRGEEYEVGSEGDSSEARKNNERGRGKRHWKNGDTSSGHASRPYKRPRMMRIRLLFADDGFTTLNSGMPSRRVIDIGTRVSRRYDEVTRDIGYQPRFGVKWKGKSTITSERLQKMRGEKRALTRSSAAINQSQNSTTRKPSAP